MTSTADFRHHGYFRKGFDVIAHRGSSTLWPENTLYAFEKAIEAHPSCILELDVHCTLDQKIVVCHDPTTERVADQGLRLILTNYDVVKSLDAGHHFSFDGGKTFPERGKNLHIPLLEEVLNAFPTSRVSIDIKEKSTEITELVVAVAEKCNGIDRVVIASEHDDNLALVRKKHPAFATGFSATESWQAFGSELLLQGVLFPKGGDVFQVPASERFGPGGSIRVQVVNKKFIDIAHSHGKRVHAWTINDPEEMMALIEQGVDGIVTDAPGLLAKVARQLGRELS